LWSGMVAAAFWQEGRNVRRAFQSRTFLKAVGIAIGLHALWNAPLGPIAIGASAVLSVMVYKKLLAQQAFWR